MSTNSPLNNSLERYYAKSYMIPSDSTPSPLHVTLATHMSHVNLGA